MGIFHVFKIVQMVLNRANITNGSKTGKYIEKPSNRCWTHEVDALYKKNQNDMAPLMSLFK